MIGENFTMGNMKNINGFLDNYIKKYGNTSTQEREIFDVLSYGYKIITYIEATRSGNYYCYRIGGIIDNDSAVEDTGDPCKRDRVIHVFIDIPFPINDKRIRVKPKLSLRVSKSLLASGLDMDRFKIEEVIESGSQVLYEKELKQIRDAVFYMEYIKRLLRNFACVIDHRSEIKHMQ